MNNVGLPEVDTGGNANADHGGASPSSDSILLKRLEGKIRAQAKELTHLKSVLREKNIQMDALHHVWCSGGCTGGTHRSTPNVLTEQMVKEAERNTARLRQWFESHKYRVQQGWQSSSLAKDSVT